ncbi:flagellar hook capping FlgD N-terminal domain-containing protein [Sporolactobacillus vineae]|uniref:flagellar hook capping FlgD N-terminal domain-containing protein n=1 Tax=Sporolactobacillus vineae TaxID=444463 RepID=UPI0002898886|nr:flagellar hook capping FlgD N-terminal domain-containing protein [Sporolactobacillus vineae]
MSSDGMTVDSSTPAGQTNAAADASSILNKDDFLKLLIAQMTHQDPTSPMDSGQFVSQMAQFTSLEQTQNMGSAIDQLVASQSDNSLADRATMIGKQVTWTATQTDQDGRDVSESLSGIVGAVKIKDGKISYVIKSGDSVDPEAITQITDTAGNTNDED